MNNMSGNTMKGLIMDSEDVKEAMRRVLRIVLSWNRGPATHSNVRGRALGRDTRARSKYAVDTALLTLVDHGMLHRIGTGPSAIYFIPSDVHHMACEAAYEDLQAEDVENAVSLPYEIDHAQVQENSRCSPKFSHHNVHVPFSASSMTKTGAMNKVASMERMVSPCSLGTRRRVSSPRVSGGLRSSHVTFGLSKGERRFVPGMKRQNISTSMVDDELHTLFSSKRIRTSRSPTAGSRDTYDPGLSTWKNSSKSLNLSSNVEEENHCKPMSP